MTQIYAMPKLRRWAGYRTQREIQRGWQEKATASFTKALNAFNDYSQRC